MEWQNKRKPISILFFDNKYYIWEFDHDDYIKNDEIDYFEGEYLNGEIYNCKGKFQNNERRIELNIINRKFKALFYYYQQLIIKYEVD